MIAEIRGILAPKSGLRTHSAEYLARDDHIVRIGISPLISDEFVAALLARIAVMDGSLNITL